MLATCFGGMCVASKTCRRLLAASVSHSSLLVGREADAVAGAAVALHRALLESLHLDPMQHLAALEIAHFEAEQLVDVHKAQRLAAVDREGPDGRAERARPCG